MKDLDQLVRSDWESLHMIGRIAQKLGVKKGQTITARIDEMIDVVQGAYSIKEPTPELTAALNRLNRSIP